MSIETNATERSIQHPRPLIMMGIMINHNNETQINSNRGYIVNNTGQLVGRVEWLPSN